MHCAAPRSFGLRSNTPLAPPSSHHIPYASPQLHAGDQQPQSGQSTETHHAQLAPSNDSCSSPLTEEDMKDESEQQDIVHNDLWNIEEEKEQDDRLEEEEEKEDDKGEGWNKQDREHRIPDVPVQDEHMFDNSDPHGGTSTPVAAPAVSGELYFIQVSLDNSCFHFLRGVHI